MAVASVGLRIDLSGSDTRVCGRGRRGELRVGVHDFMTAFFWGESHVRTSKLTLFFLAELSGMLISDDGDWSGVLSGFFAVTLAIALGCTGLSPNGSSRNWSVSSMSMSLSVSSMSFGGVGGRTESDSNLDKTIAVLVTNEQEARKRNR